MPPKRKPTAGAPVAASVVADLEPELESVDASVVTPEASISASTASISFPSRGSRTITEDDYVTVIVTPKLSFQLCKRPEWRTVQDITQEELRRGFLSRFPPALWMSSEKFSFRPALPPTSQITEETRSLVFKIVSDEVADDRILLAILRELEKSYEGIIRRAVNETRTEALQEQISLQEQAEEARREQEKQVRELKKDNRSLRDQLQSIQKRLFLVEQEKDQLRKEQQQLNDRIGRECRERAEEVRSLRSDQVVTNAALDALRFQLEEQQRWRQRVEAEASSRAAEGEVGASHADITELHAEIEAMRERLKVAIEQEVVSAVPLAVASRATVATDTFKPGGDGRECPPPPPQLAAHKELSDAASQTDAVGGEAALGTGIKEDIAAVAKRMDALQQRFAALQGWLLQGSQLLSGAAPAVTPVTRRVRTTAAAGSRTRSTQEEQPTAAQRLLVP